MRPSTIGVAIIVIIMSGEAYPVSYDRFGDVTVYIRGNTILSIVLYS
jgi:hypothetical protein